MVGKYQYPWPSGGSGQGCGKPVNLVIRDSVLTVIRSQAPPCVICDLEPGVLHSAKLGRVCRNCLDLFGGPDES